MTTPIRTQALHALPGRRKVRNMPVTSSSIVDGKARRWHFDNGAEDDDDDDEETLSSVDGLITAQSLHSSQLELART